MPVHFLFPSHPLHASVIDDAFADQRAAAEALGFTTSLCSDDVLDARKPLRNVPAGGTVVYWGWMMTGPQYERLSAAVVAAGAVPLTSPAQYLSAHHLPNWYPRIADLTPETVVLDVDADLEAELRRLAWDAFFVKDYVKSLKTSVGSVVRDPATIGTVVAEMRRFRGDIEGGLCVRRLEPFVEGTERRYFVVRVKPYAANDDPVPDIVRAAAGRIAGPFFSIDVAQRVDGVPRVVEIGDGQVSDLVGWTPRRFYEVWRG